MIKIHLRSHFNTYIKPSLLCSVMVMTRKKSGPISLQLCKEKAYKGTFRAKGQATARVTPPIICVIFPHQAICCRRAIGQTIRVGARKVAISYQPTSTVCLCFLKICNYSTGDGSWIHSLRGLDFTSLREYSWGSESQSSCTETGARLRNSPCCRKDSHSTLLESHCNSTYLEHYARDHYSSPKRLECWGKLLPQYC